MFSSPEHSQTHRRALTHRNTQTGFVYCPRPHCPRSKLVSRWWSRHQLTVIEVCMRQSFSKITLDLDSVDVTISSCLLLSRIDSQSLLLSLCFSACLWFWQVQPIWFFQHRQRHTDKCDSFFSLLYLIWNPKPWLFRWSEHPFELKCWDYFPKFASVVSLMVHSGKGRGRNRRKGEDVHMRLQQLLQ